MLRQMIPSARVLFCKTAEYALEREVPAASAICLPSPKLPGRAAMSHRGITWPMSSLLNNKAFFSLHTRQARFWPRSEYTEMALSHDRIHMSHLHGVCSVSHYTALALAYNLVAFAC